MGRALLEVCVGDPEGLEAAVAGGADRIELCSALEVGGLTPGPGLLRLARNCPVPVHVLLRPRAGDFCYSPVELDALTRDLEAARDAGSAGVVLGASRSDFTLDEPALERLLAGAGGLQTTLHRAFDLVPDRLGALETAVRLGFHRILTSAGARTAPEGADELARLVHAAGGRIIVLAGSGITAGTVRPILAAGVTEVHASCSAPGPAADPAVVRFGFGSERPRRTDAGLVAALRRELELPTGP